MRHIIFIFFFFGLSFITAQADSQRIQMEEILSPELDKDPSLSFTLLYQTLSTSLYFAEPNFISDEMQSRTETNFVSFETQSEIDLKNLTLDVSKEFFAENYISMALGARVGFIRGSSNSQITNSDILIDTTMTGFSYGTGLSLNLNSVGYGIKIQPFISSYFMINDSEIDVSYGQTKGKSLKGNTDVFYDSNIQYWIHSLGIRFINPRVGLMSFISIDYIQDQKYEIEYISSDSQYTSAFTNISDVEQKNVVYTLGIGFLF